MTSALRTVGLSPEVRFLKVLDAPKNRHAAALRKVPDDASVGSGLPVACPARKVDKRVKARKPKHVFNHAQTGVLTMAATVGSQSGCF